MMHFDLKSKTLTMDLMNLEHCGFDRTIFVAELFLNGIDNDMAKNPDKIIVNFKGKGHADNKKERLK